jgi:hypothetical protein
MNAQAPFQLGDVVAIAPAPRSADALRTYEVSHLGLDEMAMVWPISPDDSRDGFWTGVGQLTLVARHADYPHEHGRLIGCPACEVGPCQCDPETEAPCVSTVCQQRREVAPCND